MLKEENLAEKILTVGGIKVLGSIEGSGFEKIKENVDLLQEKLNTVRIKQDDYWSGLSADGIISRLEKKTLKKEYESIDTVHNALIATARAKGVENTSEVLSYDAAFNSLHDYLYVELKLFDNMEEDTEIESSEVFNGYYNTYYRALQNAQNRVNIGDPGTIRVLSSLQDLGVDGEVALYENNFYMYDITTHEWIGISVASKLGEYMGVLTESPPQVLNQYFLVGPSGIYTDTLDFKYDSTHTAEWVDETGEIIYINYGFETGFIYYWSENNEFVKVTDKNNWRYIVAMNDMIACGYEVSPELLNFLKITLKDELADELEQDVLDHAPKYLGQVKAVPADPHNGDWFIWATTTTSRFTKGHVYCYEKATVRWIELDPTDTDGKVQDMFMTALNDILSVNPAEIGYFSTVFALAFYSNTAVINKIRSQTIELEDTGYIRSRGFVSGSKGWNISGTGHAEFSDISINSGYATEEEVQDISTKVDNTITRVDVEYALGDSETEAPLTGWQTLAPAWEDGKYMWQRTAFTKNGSTSYSAITCISGATGQTGKSVTQFIEQYYLSTSKTELTGGSWQNTQPTITTGKYIWTRTKMEWTDDTVSYTDPIFAGTLDQLYSSSISTVDVEYAQGTSETVAPKTGWTTKAPAWEDGKYMWQRTKIVKNGKEEYTATTCITGAKGNDGIDGDEVTEFIEQYYLSTSKEELADGDWQDNQPTLTTGKYIWTRTKMIWKSGEVSYTTAIFAAALDQLYENSISTVDVEYALSDSATVAPAEGSSDWSTTAPEWENGKYMWQHTKIVKNGATTYTDATCISGAKGNDGTDGTEITQLREMYYSSTSQTKCEGDEWEYDQPELTTDRYVWTKTEITWSDGERTYTDPIFAASVNQLFQKSISKVDVEYALGDNPTTAPTTGWTTTAPEWENGKYMWQRTVVVQNGVATETAKTCITGAKGNDGTDGDDGDEVIKFTEQYYLSTSKTKCTGGGWQDNQPTLTTGKYIWTRTKMEWKSGKDATYTTAMFAAALDQLYTSSISKVDVEYALGDNPTTAPTTGWTTTAPEWENGKYMWQRTMVTKNGVSKPSAVTCISGAKGNTGDPGESGIYTSEFREMYALSDSSTTAPETGWQYDQPTLEDNKYIWTKTRMLYSDGSGPVYTEPVCVTFLNAIIDGSVEFKDLHGEILQEASDPDGWAIRTKDFDPIISTSGFGIRKNGNVFANNGVFRGTVFATDGEFTGIIKATGGTFENGKFNGQLDCGNVQVNKDPVYMQKYQLASSTGVLRTTLMLESYGYKRNTVNHVDKLHLRGTVYQRSSSGDTAYTVDTDTDYFYYETYSSSNQIGIKFHFPIIEDITGYKLPDAFIEKYGNDTSIGIEMTFYEDVSTGLTFKLIDLPTSRPADPGIVWNDNGNLRVSL